MLRVMLHQPTQRKPLGCAWNCCAYTWDVDDNNRRSVGRSTMYQSSHDMTYGNVRSAEVRLLSSNSSRDRRVSATHSINHYRSARKSPVTPPCVGCWKRRVERRSLALINQSSKKCKKEEPCPNKTHTTTTMTTAQVCWPIIGLVILIKGYEWSHAINQSIDQASFAHPPNNGWMDGWIKTLTLYSPFLMVKHKLTIFILMWMKIAGSNADCSWREQAYLIRTPSNRCSLDHQPATWEKSLIGFWPFFTHTAGPSSGKIIKDRWCTKYA